MTPDKTIDGFDTARWLGPIDDNLKAITAFWRERGLDPAGGYNTVFDRDGVVCPTSLKTLVAQTRILWTYSSLAQFTGDQAFADLAGYGFDFLVQRFHDEQFGGWYWSVDGDQVVDPAKLMYGQSFAIYGLCAFATATGDQAARDLAVGTFDVIHQAADLAYGGFWENIDRQWAPEDSPSGRRKSLDIHLHLMEAFTALGRLTGDKTHLRRLAEIRDLLLRQMIDPASGVGGTQYDAAFVPLEPIVIDRTWIAERTEEAAQAPGAFTTSYSHNLELGWLLGDADELLDGNRGRHADLVDHLADHTLRFGYDHDNGGVYREGPPLGPATDQDKEFWQNAEALIGFLHAYELTGKPEYAAGFAGTWTFAQRHLIHPSLGEWHIRASRTGQLIDDALGNQWTGGYHTVRAPLECRARLTRLAGA